MHCPLVGLILPRFLLYRNFTQFRVLELWALLDLKRFVIYFNKIFKTRSWVAHKWAVLLRCKRDIHPNHFHFHIISLCWYLELKTWTLFSYFWINMIVTLSFQNDSPSNGVVDLPKWVDSKTEYCYSATAILVCQSCHHHELENSRGSSTAKKVA
jgi:hypothetical protein